jgi:gliding motility-associated-like protein
VLLFGNYETAAGLYRRTFQAVNGCDSMHQIELAVLPVFQTTELREICAGDSLLIFGNYETSAGLYSRTFQAANGCDSVRQIELTVLPVFQTTELREICTGDSALVFGNYETAAGLYSRTFQAANGCDSVHQVELAVLPVFQTTELRQICTGDSVLVFGNYEAAAGLYSRTFQASGGCDSIHTVALAVFPEEQTAEFRQICTGDSSLVFGFYEHTAGVYSRVLQTQHGCDSTHTITLTVLPALETLQNLSVCTGDSILILGQYVRDAGVYTGIFQAVGGCDSVVTITLEELTAPVLQSTNMPSCADTLTGAIAVMPAGGTPPFSIVWAQNGLSGFAISGLGAGDYSATVTDQAGCTNILTTSILEMEAPVLDLLWLDPTCFGNADGQLIIENAPTGVVFSLDGAPFSTAQVYTALTSGTHTLQVRDTVGCVSETKTTLVEPSPLLVYLPGDTLIEQGQFVEIQSEVLGDAAQFTWSPGAGLNCPICPVVLAKPVETTLYTLTVRDLSGCTASDQIQITVQPKSSNKVYLPNVFRPDSGGANQFFTVYAGDNVREVIRLEVYDRWGDLVFRREHFAPGVEVLGWNGASRGQPVPPGVYVYSAEVAFSDGTTGRLSGDVTVVR